MSNPIGDQAAEHLIHHGVLTAEAVRHVWHDITHRNQPHAYHQPQDPERTPPVSLLDDMTSELTALATDASSIYQHGKTVLEQHLPGISAVVAQAEQDAAKVARYESEPIITDIAAILEAAVPGAREVIAPVVAMLKGLAAAAPAQPVAAEVQQPEAAA